MNGSGVDWSAFFSNPGLYVLLIVVLMLAWLARYLFKQILKVQEDRISDYAKARAVDQATIAVMRDQLERTKPLFEAATKFLDILATQGGKQ